MNGIVLAGFLLAGATMSLAQGGQEMPMAVEATEIAKPATVVIDLSKPLPTKLDLVVGQGVLMENVLGRITARDTDGQGKLLEPRPHNTFNQAAAFFAVRAGKGEIELVLPQDGLATVPVTKKIAVTVTLPGKEHKVEYRQPFPATLDLKVGESVIFYVRFSGDPGLYDPVTYPSARTTDGKSGDVLDAQGPVKRLDKEHIQVKRFTATRAGDAEIVIRALDGKEVATIKVTVKQ